MNPLDGTQLFILLQQLEQHRRLVAQAGGPSCIVCAHVQNTILEVEDSAMSLHIRIEVAQSVVTQAMQLLAPQQDFLQRATRP
jgi:hypothetical protein